MKMTFFGYLLLNIGRQIKHFMVLQIATFYVKLWYILLRKNLPILNSNLPTKIPDLPIWVHMYALLSWLIQFDMIDWLIWLIDFRWTDRGTLLAPQYVQTTEAILG